MQDGTAKNLIKLIIIALLWLTTTSYATELTNEALIKALRAGGYTLYFRHEATNWSQDDYIDKREDWLSCDPAKVRQLSEQGRQQASATGKAIRSLGIPVSRVLASPYCRTVETAKLMNLGAVQPSNDVINLRVASYFGGRNAIVKTPRASCCPSQRIAGPTPLSSPTATWHRRQPRFIPARVEASCSGRMEKEVSTSSAA